MGDPLGFPGWMDGWMVACMETISQSVGSEQHSGSMFNRNEQEGDAMRCDAIT